MNHLFKYIHNGEGGCGKTAFYTLTKPKPGKSLADGVVITVDGTRAEIQGALMCGHCHNGVLGLRVDNLKKARPEDAVKLLISSVNQHTTIKGEVKVVNDMLLLMHELLVKMKAPDNAPEDMVYVGSMLEAGVKEMIDYQEPGIFTGFD